MAVPYVFCFFFFSYLFFVSNGMARRLGGAVCSSCQSTGLKRGRGLPRTQRELGMYVSRVLASVMGSTSAVGCARKCTGRA